MINWINYLKYLLGKPAKGISRWTAFWCRLKKHPAGVIWYNPSGLEPDMRCSKCFDDLG
jgi:hypothetical protein